jgi:hypothetical protein
MSPVTNRTKIRTFDVILTFIPSIFVLYVQYTWARGGAVVEALRYKPEGRGVDSR